MIEFGRIEEKLFLVAIAIATGVLFLKSSVQEVLNIISSYDG